MKLKNGTRPFFLFLILATFFPPKLAFGDGVVSPPKDFRLQVANGETVEVLVPQTGEDVELDLVGPDEKVRLSVDRPNGGWGNERVLFTADLAGEWAIRFRKGKTVDSSKFSVLRNPSGRSVADVSAFSRFHQARKRNVPAELEFILPDLPEWMREEGRFELALQLENVNVSKSLALWREIRVEKLEKGEQAAFGATFLWLGGRLFEKAQEPGEAQRLFLETSKRYEDFGDRRRKGILLIEAGRMARRLDRLDEAERLYLDGLPLLPQGQRTRGLADLNYADILIDRGRFGAARRVLRVVGEVGEKLNDIRLITAARQGLALVDNNLGYPEIAEVRLAREVLALREKLGGDDLAVLLSDLAETRRQSNRLYEALSLSKEAESLAKTPRAQGIAQRITASILFDLGQVESGMAMTRTALERLPPTDPFTIFIRLEIGWQLVKVGKPGEALEIAKKFVASSSPEVAGRAATLAGICSLQLQDSKSADTFFQLAAGVYDRMGKEVSTVAEKRALGRKFWVLPGLGAAAVPDDPAEAVRRLERYRCRTAFPVGTDTVQVVTSAARREAEQKRALLLAKGDPDSKAAAAQIAGDLLLDLDDEAPGKIPATPENPWELLEAGEVAVIEVALPQPFFLVCRKNGVIRTLKMPKIPATERRIFIPDPVRESRTDSSGWIEVSSLGLYLTLRDNQAETGRGVLGISLTREIGGLPVLPEAVRDLSSIPPGLVRMLSGPMDEDRLRSDLVKERPSIVHFGTHGSPDEVIAGKTAVIVEGRNGPLPITARVFRNLPATPRLVVLAACRTTFGPRFGAEGRDDLPAEIIRSGIPCVVAADGPLEDGYAGKFFQVFYRRLSMGKPVSESLKWALQTCGKPPLGTQIRQFGADVVPFAEATKVEIH